ncbi:MULTISPECIES: hypothetical protein [Calothrix]|uniref:Uncharacterized protein n=2 Tax=Calothrix TaxID=1186 RepID=A0ABR8ABZ8_9CYAN|nr:MULTISPECIES: hypothetical protein [Calothrix]MBD2196838.1 hypothetical protein [Calothrix parietina FACHB-288]MBD2225390.1 hypothetical protein [Calothrix anomala FACHB-343]
MEPVAASELKLNKLYKVEFLNGSKLIVSFAGFKGGRYYFFNETGQQFSIADNTIKHLRFYK